MTTERYQLLRNLGYGATAMVCFGLAGWLLLGPVPAPRLGQGATWVLGAIVVALVLLPSAQPQAADRAQDELFKATWSQATSLGYWLTIGAMALVFLFDALPEEPRVFAIVFLAGVGAPYAWLSLAALRGRI